MNPVWLAAYGGLWISLALLADMPSTGDFAAALAGIVALTATFTLWERVADKLPF